VFLPGKIGNFLNDCIWAFPIGVWLESGRTLEHYLLRENVSLWMQNNYVKLSQIKPNIQPENIIFSEKM
jgi:hypothetical protein